MNKIALPDIKNILEYEKVREEFRDRIIELKKSRRIAVGDLITFVFENRDTVLFQIQEMVRAERLVDEDRIQDEIDVFNELIPPDGQLSATMFIEITDQASIRPTLERLVGITRRGVAYLGIGDDNRVNADFEQGREEEEAGKVSAVQYAKFKLSADDIARVTGGEPLSLVVDHPNYKAAAILGEVTVAALKDDLCQ
jgi:hypothetical protein